MVPQFHSSPEADRRRNSSPFLLSGVLKLHLFSHFYKTNILLKLGTTSCPLIPLKTNFSTILRKEETGVGLPSFLGALSS